MGVGGGRKDIFKLVVSFAVANVRGSIPHNQQIM